MNAVLLVNVQNEFVRPGGKLYDVYARSLQKSGMFEKIVKFVHSVRASGALVIHSPVIMKIDDQIKLSQGINLYSNTQGLLIEGTWNCEIPQDVKHSQLDVVLSSKSGVSAFSGTDLELIINENDIKRVFIAGLITNECIHQTVEDCVNIFGTRLEIYILEDCCIAETDKEHLDALSSLKQLSNVIIYQDAKKLLNETNYNQSNTTSVNINSLLSNKVSRPRILAIHGARSNNDVTKLQLQNLNITESDYDIFYHNGPIKVFEPDPALEGIVHGPFYSWFDVINDEALGKSLIAAVHNVLHTIKINGPFNGIYGFSSGAIIASLVSGISNDKELLQAVKTYRPEISHSSYDLNVDISVPKIQFAILACTASPTGFQNLRELAGIKGNLSSLISVPSFHLIGIEDDFKTQSEYVATLFSNCQIRYLPGGHNVGRIEIKVLHDFMKSSGVSAQNFTVPEFTPISETSSVSVLPTCQVVLVNIINQNSTNESTILSVLRSHRSHKPFLYISRTIENPTSYGDVLNFIHGGMGDLRRLGVKPGEVVAYCAPPAAAASAALAFLSIGAQTSAAPLDPNLSRIDALDALDQFNAKHLILFKDVECPGLAAAFTEYTQFGRAKLHTARIIGDSNPGIFEYQEELSSLIEQLPLTNSENETCLLLRTSGTTARPKGIPLIQKSLIINSRIIAKSMQLTEKDVCYSIMPLFHIGGISASILSTMVSGGAICCDDKPFSPETMIDALAISRPQPTWYSAVPTIHNSTVAYLKEMGVHSEKHKSYGIDSNGRWKSGHSLRMIRSGAAVLLGSDGKALAVAFGDLPIYPTYSMSEQMPISQPPAGKVDMLLTKPGSVGIPVAATTAILNPNTLLPQPPGVQGEIAICGQTVAQKYLNNLHEDAKSFVYLTLPLDLPNIEMEHNLPKRFFLTGDLGLIDTDGFLYLMGRSKELIKKGGEQISPFEVEEIIVKHPWIQTVVCFAVSSDLYGEEVGCALVLSSSVPKNMQLREVTIKMRSFLKESEFALLKWPTKWKICDERDLPKTRTKKYKRIGLAKVLGFEQSRVSSDSGSIKFSKTKIDWNAINGFRFLLACYVMFMHIGSNSSWGRVSNLRGSPWHLHTFFTLGGFSLAAPMNPSIPKKFQYFLARIGNMYPMYLVALCLCLINLLLVCRPSTFNPNFHWDAQPYDLYSDDGSLTPPFCEGTPATPTSFWKSLLSTIFLHVFGLAVTPFWPLTWWLGYYLWFNSMYYQCLAAFPSMYNTLYNRTRKNTRLLLKLILAMLVLNAVLLTSFWFIFTNDSLWQETRNPPEYTDGHVQNAWFLSFYLFGPFWIMYFIIGVLLAFLYDAVQPSEKHSAWIWGWIADGIALSFVILSIAQVSQGIKTNWFMRPYHADSHNDSDIANRLWDNIYGRLLCPLTTIFIFAITTGQGRLVKILGSRNIVEGLAPHSYNCFLFHQQVAQWYYIATRNGNMWSWWNYRKTIYWFSPQPLPVEWYEYFTIVGIIILFSHFIISLESVVHYEFRKCKEFFGGKVEIEEATLEVVCNLIQSMTGIEPQEEWSLEECGLGSIGMPVLVRMISRGFSGNGKSITLTIADIVQVKTIRELVIGIDAAKAIRDAQGV